MAESEIITPETETITTEIIVDPESGAGELVVADMDVLVVCSSCGAVGAPGWLFGWMLFAPAPEFVDAFTFLVRWLSVVGAKRGIAGFFGTGV